jgi:hypothetical protein
MKRIFISMLGLLMAITAFSQPVTITENFDGNDSTFTSYPASAWKIDKNYYSSSPYAIHGLVPNMQGDSAILTTPVYNFTNYRYVLLRFSHICKVSPRDIARIEYRTDMGGGVMSAWEVLPFESYLGKANKNHYAMYGFNADSYSEWAGNDSLILPLQSSWWKDEIFDLRTEAGQSFVQFRFIIRHGTVSGTQISYGWLIDDIEIIVAPYELLSPVVELFPPFIKDTVYSTGPWEINAKVKTQTTAQIVNPWLVYTATNNQGTINDSVLMTMVRGDSLWKGNIPQFAPGTEVVYSITGRDIFGNYSETISSDYIIQKPNHHYGDTSVALTKIVSPVRGQVIGNTTVSIAIKLRNKGDSALTSATIYQSVNGVITTYPWADNLSWDIEEQVSLGTYQPRMNGFDTIVIWVSAPNGISDVVLTDDTLSIITYGCSGGISGFHTVGTNGLFPTLQQVIDLFNDCIPNGDITLALENGIYTENINLSNIGNLMGNYTLTITSLSNNADSVILRAPSGVGITLSNTHNLILQAITVDAASHGTYGIQVTGYCSNIVLNNCVILASPSSTANAYAGIYKATNTGSLIDMKITNCSIQGGYYGIYLYGTSVDYCQNITIDNNTINNQYNYGSALYYVNLKSFSYNQIKPRSFAQGTTWYGAYFYNVRNGGDIIGNRIWANNSGITSNLRGIHIEYMDSIVVANNEIHLNSSATTTYGMYLYYSKNVDYLHNTVLLTGTGGATFRTAQIYTATTPSYNATYKNNIFIANGGTTPYAVYLSAAPDTTFAQYNHFDYNNYYSSGNLGYAGSARSDLAAWKSVVPTDSNSVNKLPNFLETSTSLELFDYDSLYCILIPNVGTDIQNSNRGTTTTMGCYQEIVLPGNGALMDVSGLRKGTVIDGETDSIKVIFINLGTTVLNSVNLSWSINGTIQTTKEYFFTRSLSRRQSDTITLDKVTYMSENMDFKIWINSLENGTLSDGFSLNDTVNAFVFVCGNTITGIIAVGNTGSFSTITAALQAVRTCGRGDITLLLDSGVYQENCDFSRLNNIVTGNTLTITSKTGKAEDVIIRPTANVALRMENTHNIRIENITIDAAQGTYGVQFVNTCSNIIMDNCIILANPTATTVAYGCIYKAANTGALNGLSITNCGI